MVLEPYPGVGVDLSRFKKKFLLFFHGGCKSSVLSYNTLTLDNYIQLRSGN